jgi:hypothetical protein
LFKVFDYFTDNVPVVADIVEMVSNDVSKELKQTKNALSKLQNENALKDKELNIINEQLFAIRSTFKSVDFKNISLFGSYSIKKQDLEILRNVIGCE